MDDDYISVGGNDLSVEAAMKLVTCPSAGAISLFIGTTRDNFEGQKVMKLEYEAYEPMAIREMKNICKLIREKWEVKKICIMHRIGCVPVTEASVIIAISAVHRTDSIEAVQFAIDTLKARVPIWKKEVYENGECSWKENKECLCNHFNT